MKDCLFCNVVNGSVPVKAVIETDTILAFEDIQPQAPIHVLIITKKHIASINDIKDKDKEVCGEMLLAAKKLAEMLGIKDSGYRTIFNTNEDGGQTVYHIHMHLLGGRKLKWPPG